MWVVVLASCVLGIACGFRVSTGSAGGPDDGGAIDGGGDAREPPVDGPPGTICYGTGLVSVCFPAAPTGSMSPTGPFDTDGTGCTVVAGQTAGPELCVLAAAQLTVTGSFVATGTRALVLIGAETVSVSGTIDVSSKQSGQRGAGSNPSTCTSAAHAAGPGRADSGGGGGGAGGSFGTVGGIGGFGDANSNGDPGQGVAGIPGSAEVPVSLRGGCPGGAGGAGGGGGDSGGQGGRGGGAVYLIAATAITIDGNVFASGAGGTISGGSAGYQDGGGGGGSGGMIGLDAPSILISGRVVANGAGGSGGGGNSGGGPGGDGTTTMWNVAATGGTAGPTVAGPGGSGTAVGMVSAVTPAAADAGGGGGGGGLGVVWIDGTVSGSQVSPAPSPH